MVETMVKIGEQYGPWGVVVSMMAAAIIMLFRHTAKREKETSQTMERLNNEHAARVEKMSENTTQALRETAVALNSNTTAITHLKDMIQATAKERQS